MPIFDIVYNTVVPTEMPVRRRTARHIAWLRALVAGGVGNLYNQLLTYRAGYLYGLAHNSQIAFLQAALNDVFDMALRRIVIDDPLYADPLWIYRTTEGRTAWVGATSEAPISYSPRWLFRTSEAYTVDSVVFVVVVPGAVAAMAGYSVTRLRALVDKYRLPGKKNYTVVVV